MAQMKKILLYSLFVLVGCLILSTLFFAIRQGVANAEIERAGQTAPASVPDLGTTTRLEILPLYEEDRADESLETLEAFQSAFPECLPIG